MFPKLLLTLFTACAICGLPNVDGRKVTEHQIRAKQAEAAKRWETEGAVKRASSKVQNITFSNPKASSKYASDLLPPDALIVLGFCTL
jgi:hypothetical protein